MTIELRCPNHLHMMFDPEHLRIYIKCRKCSGLQKRSVFHQWSLSEIVAQYQAGDVVPVCFGDEPTFVRWAVTSS